MTDNTQPEALREGFTAADMATAEARGFRDGVASCAASAGSEPVAWQYQGRDGLWRDFIDERHRKNTVDSGEWPIRALYLHPSPPEGMVGGWQDIATAPKSSTDGRNVDGIYLLGYCPEPDACNLQSYICIVWWEPNMKGGKGMWYGEGGYEVHPTHWMPLPPPPTSAEGVEHA